MSIGQGGDLHICGFRKLHNHTHFRFSHSASGFGSSDESPKSCEEGRNNIETGSKVSLCVSGLCDPYLKFIIHFISIISKLKISLFK